MMTIFTRASDRQTVSLVKQIADSGEGEVWETNFSGILAKIYHNPTPERIEKLKAMLANPPVDPMKGKNHISIAFPQDLLQDGSGNCVGFLMPTISSSRELPSIYNPRLRKKNAPGFNWYYLHVTALNTAWIIQAIHEKGYVLGDIKPQNILVNDRALVAVIDTDSFQVCDRNSGKVYRCTVGSDGFTPVELLGKDFAVTDQSEVCDRFRLAVLIHYLLFGYHPFSGEWTGTGESLEQTELIHKGLWYGGNNSLIRPSQTTIPLDVVHPEIKRLFLKCFNNGHASPKLRPTAEDWHNALQAAVNDLTICGKLDSHYYSRSYAKCYWCERAEKTGVDIFPAVFDRSGLISTKTITREKVAAANTLYGHLDLILSIAISSDGQTLISGSADKTIKIWNLAGEKELMTLYGHSNSVLSVAISPDGQTLVSGSADKTIKIWNLAEGKRGRTLYGHSKSVSSVTIRPNGQTLVSGSLDKGFKVWNLFTGKRLRSFHGGSDSVLSVAISPDGQTLVNGSVDKIIKVWSLSTGKEFCIHTLEGHSNSVSSVAISPNGQTLVSGSADKTIKIWNLSTGKELYTLEGHSASVLSVAISPNGQTIVSGSADKTIKIWNLSTGKELYTLEGHSASVLSIAISPNGQTIVSGSADKTIKIWHIPR